SPSIARRGASGRMRYDTEQRVPRGNAELAEGPGERRGLLRSGSGFLAAGARQAPRELAVSRHGDHAADVVLRGVAEERLGLFDDVPRRRNPRLALGLDRGPEERNGRLRAHARAEVQARAPPLGDVAESALEPRRRALSIVC